MKRVVITEGTWTYSDYAPTGKLSFRLDDLYGKEWKDTKVKLEEKLPSILAGFELKADKEKIERAKRDAWHREYQQQLKEEREQEEQRLLEIKEFNMLLSDAENWNKSKLIGSYLKEVESKLETESLNQEEINQWLKWANEKLKQLNPISEGVTQMVNSYSRYNSI
jgi:hypothetical protein